MSGYYHHENDSISPYYMGNAGTPDADDETYLQMDQFQDLDPRSNIRSQLNNVLTLHNSEKSTLVTLPSRHNYHLPSGCSDWPVSPTSQTNNLSNLPSPRPAPRSVVSNYTKWDPAKKANRSAASGPPGNPPIQPLLPARALEGPAVIDQEDYLSFESPGQGRSSQPHYPFPQGRRPPAPPPIDEPPRRPPKSPARPGQPGRSSYDDHCLSLRPLPLAHDRDQPPERPPPPPPVQTPPYIVPPYPFPVSPNIDRQGSDKSNSSHSPVASRPSSLKDPHTSHIPNRENHKSTESTGSTSSEDLAQIPRPSYAPSHGFVSKKIPDRMMPKFPKIPSQHRPPLPFQMPTFGEPSSASVNQDQDSPKSEPAGTVEEQPYFQNVNRQTAQDNISNVDQDGAFIVRPRQEFPLQPYALTLWAKRKFYNFLIRKRSDGEYALGKKKDDELAFSSISVMIDYYRKHDLVLAENEGSVKLTFSP